MEKIGSGNWYWAFASEDKKTHQKALEDASAAHDKAALLVEDLKQRLAEVQAQREDEEDMLDSGAESREELMSRRSVLETGILSLQKELAAYSDSDPTELERKKKEIEGFKCETEQYTDDVYSMEGWFKKQGQDEESLKQLRSALYGDQLDGEEGILREI